MLRMNSKSSKDFFTIAAVQFPISGGQSKTDFFKKVENFIVKAKYGGASLVIFPELITADLVSITSNQNEAQSMKNIALEFTTEYVQWIQKKLVEHGLAIMAGTSPRNIEDKIVNTAFLVFPSGELFQQDKVFLTPDEKAWGFSMGNELQVFSTPLGKMTIAICFDCEMPSLSNSLSKEKPEIILIPSWTSSQHGFNRVAWSAKARAIEHYAYVVKTGTVVGEGSHEEHFGQASIINPQDSGFPFETQDGPYNAIDILFGDLDMSFLRKSREGTDYYPDKEQDLYSKLTFN
jgi:predicted amidohydrolase